MPDPSKKVGMSDCEAMPCDASKAEHCGGSNRILVIQGVCTGKPVPNYQACVSPVALALPYCDVKLSVDDRVKDLISRLSLDDKIASISPQPKLGETCGVHSAGKASIGLPDYFWLTETNTNVAAKCYTEPWKCATTFIGPMGMGASFNKSSWKLKGDVLGTEMRAFNNIGWHRGNSNDKIAITGFGPNINIARDPRFGRASELPGEDPTLNGLYAANMVQGMQEQDANGHPKMLAYLKHFTAYSRETNRGHDNYNISMYDYWDSYLPQYEIAFKQGGASGVMCSYDAENGHPSCANSYILNDVIRKKWGQTNALVTTDCGAVSNMRGPPVNAKTDEEAAAWTINNGTDLEMGSTIWTNSMKSAVSKGLVTEATVTAAATRAFRGLMVAGRFDPADGAKAVSWRSLGTESINSTLHQQINHEAGLQGMVLLKNENGLLPLKAGSKLAVVGPMGMTTDLMSDYAGGTGEAGCWPHSDQSCILTIAQAIEQANKGGQTTSAKGVDVNSKSTAGIAAALALARAADVVVLVVGNDRSQEHEGHDRPDTGLAGQQEQFAEQVLALKKPTLLIMSNGGALAIDSLINGSSSIVEAFNPAQMTPALAQLLFGVENRWGKLPITMYPQSYTKQQPMDNYDMSKAPGRTYKYYGGRNSSEALFSFGTGLSLTTFEIGCKAGVTTGGYSYACTVKNTGKIAGDEVVMVFHRAESDVVNSIGGKHPVPLKALRAFERVHVAAGATGTVSFSLTDDALMLVDENGEKQKYKGHHSFLFTNGNGQLITETVQV
jgi:beta-glucosidase-like glycosyl hydrolase